MGDIRCGTLISHVFFGSAVFLKPSSLFCSAMGFTTFFRLPVLLLGLSMRVPLGS